MMKKIKFEITWEDVQDVAKQRNGQTLSKKVACFLLADIESGVRGWFNETKGDSICDALQMYLPSGTLRTLTPPEPTYGQPCTYGHRNCSSIDKGSCSDELMSRQEQLPIDHNDAEGVVTMRDLA